MKGFKSVVIVGIVLSLLTIAIVGCTEEIKDELGDIIRDELDELVEEVVESVSEKKDELIEGAKDDIEKRKDELIGRIPGPDQDLKGKVTVGGIEKEYYYDSGTEPTEVNFAYYWCTYYAAREFQKIAPSPKVNWGGDANKWYINAGNSGWVTTTDHSKVTKGSILLMGNHAQIVRDVRSNGLVVQGMNEGWATNHDPLDPNHQEHWYGEYKFYTGYVYKYYLTYEQIGSGYVFGEFNGYILPLRLDSSVLNNEDLQTTDA